MINLKCDFGVGTLAFLIASGIFIVNDNRKNKKRLINIEKKLNYDTSEIAKHIDISDEIPQCVIDDAVSYAVSEYAEKYAKKTSNSIKDEMNSKINKAVKEAIGDYYSSVRTHIETEIEKQIGRIDISSVKQQVIDEAARKASEKFDSDLNDISQKYKDNLDNAAKIYKTFANAIVKEV